MIVCFISLGGCVSVVWLCSGCWASSDFCLSCDACSCRWSFIGSMLVSACRCFVFVSCVHPVIVLSAMFCTICSLFVLVFAMIGDHVVFAYSSMGRVIVL